MGKNVKKPKKLYKKEKKKVTEDCQHSPFFLYVT